jgi:hypothetical protein
MWIPWLDTHSEMKSQWRCFTSVVHIHVWRSRESVSLQSTTFTTFQLLSLVATKHFQSHFNASLAISKHYHSNSHIRFLEKALILPILENATRCLPRLSYWSWHNHVICPSTVTCLPTPGSSSFTGGDIITPLMGKHKKGGLGCLFSRKHSKDWGRGKGRCEGKAWAHWVVKIKCKHLVGNAMNFWMHDSYGLASMEK